MTDTTFSPLNPPQFNQGQRSISWHNLNGCGDSMALAAAVEQGQSLFVVITADSHTALRVEHELAFFLNPDKPVLHFPDWETLPYDLFSPLPDIVSQRLKTLAHLPQVKQGVLVLSVATLMQKLAPRSHILANSFILELGETMVLDQTRTRLEQVGYHCVSQVYQHGEFTIRGAILDLFPMGSQYPYRIELFDDEVDSIRIFDPETQRTQSKVEQIQLYPAREFPFSEDSIKLFRQNFRAQFPESAVGCPLYHDVSKAIPFAGIEYYLPLFVDQTETLFDYLPDDTTLFFIGPAVETADQFYQSVESRYDQRKEYSGRPVLQPDALFLTPQQIKQRFESYRRITLIADSSVDQSAAEQTAADESAIRFATQLLPDVAIKPARQTPLQPLLDFFDRLNGRTLLVAETVGHRQTMLEQLAKQQLQPEVINDWQQFIASTAPLSITVAPMDHGVWLDQSALSIITESQLTGERVQQRRRRRSATGQELENIVNNLTELTIGAPVVHRDYGIGRYQGLLTLDAGGMEAEFLHISYAGTDKLYVPVSSLHLISRYSGASAENAPLNKLGGEQWSRARRKAMERVRDVAAELLEIYAKRAARKGFTYAMHETEFQSFSQAFPFEETPDQLSAINNVVEDMQSTKPMDRVICGDVGFGKTEVSMRAAFLAVLNSKQVAILVPTTLLAQQHFQNFRDRFADWPVRVEVLSRFITKKNQQLILADLVDGKVDILIGTHKLIQPDVIYKELGLVIIDEEHRFGVRHKEHFKQLRSELDILTMTATPIPRTLSMAMSGMRDFSIIASPPANRHAIKTFISEWNDALIQEACLREIKRGGQIYFLHNDVKSMPRMADQLAQIIPQARIECAHGQMPERQLEQVMLDFYHQRFNLLVCSTIIESGIDVPSANTIIIHRADRLGLAQLHQLRGRVGRSHHRAYAYLFIPPKKQLTRDSVKRLEAFGASNELGAGFMLASHDLEIRGAGELLGSGQSGQIQAIGFNLYTELLDRAVAALKAGKLPELNEQQQNGPEIDLQAAALITEDYMPDVHGRLVLYKRIAGAEDEAALRELQVEMIDRFGLLPEPTKTLFAVTGLKLQAAPLGIRKIEAGEEGGRILFEAVPEIQPERLIMLVQKQPDRYKLDGPDKLRFIRKLETVEQREAYIEKLLSILEGAEEPAAED